MQKRIFTHQIGATLIKILSKYRLKATVFSLYTGYFLMAFLLLNKLNNNHVKNVVIIDNSQFCYDSATSKQQHQALSQMNKQIQNPVYY